MAVRSAMHQAGAAALRELLRFPPPPADQRTLPCACGQQAHYRDLRSKPILTAVGKVEVLRPYYLCPNCHEGQFPADVELDIENTELSPGVRRMQAVVGQEAPFDHGRQQMKLLADLEVTTKSVERTAEAIGANIAAHEQEEIQRAVQLDLPIVVGKAVPILYVQMDGTGIPAVKKETVDRPGKTEGQPSHTREVKLGCVFTQTTTDEEGFAVRDPNSTSFTGAIETAEQFGQRIYAETLRRGLKRAQKVVVLADGAEWIRNLVELYFFNATQIVDLYHARERVCKIISLLFKDNEKHKQLYRLKWWSYLDEGKVEKFIASARSRIPCNCDSAEDIEKELRYFENNLERMRYNEFRKQGLFVGSGVIEAGCKSVIGSRMKQSGMEWSVRGANSIISLRCMYHSNRVEDFWAAASG